MPQQPPDIRDIKDIYSMYGWFWPLVIALGLIAAAALGYFLWRHFRKKQPAPPPPPPVPAKSSKELALEELARIRTLLGAENPKPFAFALSECVRLYLERRDGIPLTDRTTEEISGLLTGGDRDAILRLLKGTDLVKFTDHRPTREDEQNLFAAAEALVG